jgi:hypothetical protein
MLRFSNGDISNSSDKCNLEMTLTAQSVTTATYPMLQLLVDTAHASSSNTFVIAVYYTRPISRVVSHSSAYQY